MKIILTQDVANLGSLGDEIEVKGGYGRNFLIPQNMALPVTRANVKQIEHRRTFLAKKRAEAIAGAQGLAAKVAAAELVFEVKAGDAGKLFGSVTSKMVLAKFEELGIEVSKKGLGMPNAIKTLGTTIVEVRLHTEVIAKASVKVIMDAESAEAAKAAARAKKKASPDEDGEEEENDSEEVSEESAEEE